jgi:hypothetical protein
MRRSLILVVRHSMHLNTTKSVIWVIVGVLVAIALSWGCTVVIYLPESPSWLWPIRSIGVWVAVAVGVFSIAAYPFKTSYGRKTGVILAAIVGTLVLLTSIITASSYGNIS